MKRPRVYEIKPCRSASAAGGGNNRVSSSATAASQKGYQAPAADKVLDILELLAEQRVPMSGADIARGLGRTIGEIFRMLVLLERRGYVAREAGGGRYALTLRLYALAHTQDPFAQLLAAAQAPMRALAETVGESCHLGLLRHGRLMLAARAEAPRPIRLAIQPGSTFPIAETTSGRLIAAQRPPAERDAMLGLAMGDPRRRGLSRAAAEQWLCEPSLVHAGVTNLSVLVRLPDECAALTISWIAPAKDPADRRAALLDAARGCADAIRIALGLERP